MPCPPNAQPLLTCRAAVVDAQRTAGVHAASARRSRPLGEVDREALEIGQLAIGERPLMRGAQHHARRFAGFESFLPARRTKAPAIALLETGKAELRPRRRQIVAALARERQEPLR